MNQSPSRDTLQSAHFSETFKGNYCTLPNAIRLQKAMKMYSCYYQKPTNKNVNTISTKTQQRKKTESLPLPVSPRTHWALHLISTQHAQEHYFNLEVKKTVADKLFWTSDEACQMYPYKMWSDAALLKQFKLNHTAIDSYQSCILITSNSFFKMISL